MRITKLALFLLLGTLVGSRMAHSRPSDRGDGRGDARGSDRGEGRGDSRAGDRRAGDRGNRAAQEDAGQAGTRYFHQRLSRYGRWGRHARYGEVWRPRVAAGWRPYTTGHWVYTDYGWTWAADEPWGWAPFHYGRWYHESGLGWGWVPGNVWAPAWVDWRNGGGYVGWAALPPEVGFTAGVGVSFGGFDSNAALVPSYYCFVPERAILEPRLGTFIASSTRNVEIIRGTANINGIAVVDNRVVNQGVSVQRIEQLSGRAVARVQLGNQAAFYQPGVVTNAARQTRSESFVNRPAPRAASAPTPLVVAGSRTANGRQVLDAQSARRNAQPGATVRGQSRSATLPNQGQNGRNSASRSRTQHASSNQATQSIQGHGSGGTVARSHATAMNPPPHGAQQASARSTRSNTPPRQVVGANTPHGTQRSSARPNQPPRHVASANPPPHGTRQGSARSNPPPPRHVAVASPQPAHAPVQARQPPPPSKEQPQVQKQRPTR
jgi:hypothetical protein